MNKLVIIILICLNISSFRINAQKMAAGYAHSIYICADSTVWARGWNYQGELGNGSTDNFNAGKVIGLNQVVAVATGTSHCLALKSDGTVWSWGYNAEGQLGNGSYNSWGCFCDSIPKQVV